MKSSIFQKMTQKIWRISALRVFTVHRAEILQIFWVIFGLNENLKFAFEIYWPLAVWSDHIMTYELNLLLEEFVIQRYLST